MPTSWPACSFPDFGVPGARAYLINDATRSESVRWGRRARTESYSLEHRGLDPSVAGRAAESKLVPLTIIEDPQVENLMLYAAVA